MEDPDSENQVTALELRQMGIDIPPNIPDHAWVPRSSIFYCVDTASFSELRGVLGCDILIRFSEPFSWALMDVSWNAGKPYEKFYLN